MYWQMLAFQDCLKPGVINRRWGIIDRWDLARVQRSWFLLSHWGLGLTEVEEIRRTTLNHAIHLIMSLLQDPSLKRMMGSCITPVWCLGLMDSWFLNTGRYLCSSHSFHTLPNLMFQLNLRVCPHLSRFTSLTLTFQGKSASRSLRHWVQATVCQCLKLVSHIFWSVFFTSSWTSPHPNCLTPPTAFCKVGVGICYDIRFAELAQLYSRKGEWLIRPALIVWDS